MTNNYYVISVAKPHHFLVESYTLYDKGDAWVSKSKKWFFKKKLSILELLFSFLDCIVSSIYKNITTFTTNS